MLKFDRPGGFQSCKGFPRLRIWDGDLLFVGFSRQQRQHLRLDEERKKFTTKINI